MEMIWRGALIAAFFCLATPAIPQNTDSLRSAILVLDREALFRGSRFGNQLLADVDAARRALQAENRAIEAQLTEEERVLTQQRAEVDRVAFQALADAFDVKVNEIRRTQDLKAEALGQQLEASRSRFFEAVTPVLSELVVATGALVLIDRRDVIAAADQIDITRIAIQRIDEVLVAGEQAPVEPKNGTELNDN